MSDSEENNRLTAQIPVMSAFSIMFVSIGFSCFVWQALTAAWMYYQSKKPIVALVAFQAIFGVIVTFVTLLASLIDVDCTFVNTNTTPFNSSNPLTIVSCFCFL